ncbi:MAG: response regulator transcription factor [Chitinophagaceae bacterium]|nr:MAG: response regulator transcription factor [Chitinophagaceae bacterium]
MLRMAQPQILKYRLIMKDRIKVIVVDDHPVVLQGFVYMLQDLDDLELMNKFMDASTALDFVRHNEVDVVLLDINLPDMNGIEACREITAMHGSTLVIAISNINEPSIIQRMLDSGASGYLLKNCSSEEVISCINDVMMGEPGLSSDIRKIMEGYRKGEIPIVTKREQQVLAMLARGLSSTEIGEEIFISPLTVESHRRNLLQKFKVTNVAALVYRASELKFI